MELREEVKQMKKDMEVLIDNYHYLKDAYKALKIRHDLLSIIAEKKEYVECYPCGLPCANDSYMHGVKDRGFVLGGCIQEGQTEIWVKP